jgi:cytochrome c-type biogenesis protein CcsB
MLFDVNLIVEDAMKKNALMLFALWVVTLGLGASTQVFAKTEPTEALKYLPVQADGRVKPFDTFARENLSLIYGKSTYEGKAAYEIVLTWLLTPQEWEKKEFVEVSHAGVKEALKLDKMRRHFTPNEIFNSDRLALLMQDLSSKREAKEKLDAYFQGIQRIENQLSVFREIATGHYLAMFPPKEGSKWLTLAELPPEAQQSFMKITQAFVAGITAEGKKDGLAIEKAAEEMKSAIHEFSQAAKTANPMLYPTENFISLEVHYNSIHPFRWAWAFYLIAFLIAAFAVAGKREQLYKFVWIFTLLGFSLHTYGFGLRMYLTERPPVSNMFETVVWVSWGAILFSLIIEKIYRFRLTLLAGPIVATFCLILTDMAPSILDPTLQPLEPVLRSNFWLTVHVLTITISYSAFFIAFCLGDLGLYYYLKGENLWKDRIHIITNSIYRSMQIGVVLLAAGILLGGVWADYSWGRFWGWDPKETWALIALLGYIAILHARLVGLIKQFGMVVSSIVTFSLVIMAWYGVNYVLGAGLHSYGFGAGGVEYVSAFIALHLVLVVVTAIVRKGKTSELSHK